MQEIILLTRAVRWRPVPFHSSIEAGKSKSWLQCRVFGIFVKLRLIIVHLLPFGSDTCNYQVKNTRLAGVASEKGLINYGDPLAAIVVQTTSFLSPPEVRYEPLRFASSFRSQGCAPLLWRIPVYPRRIAYEELRTHRGNVEGYFTVLRSTFGTGSFCYYAERGHTLLLVRCRWRHWFYNDNSMALLRRLLEAIWQAAIKRSWSHCTLKIVTVRDDHLLRTDMFCMVKKRSLLLMITTINWARSVCCWSRSKYTLRDPIMCWKLKRSAVFFVGLLQKSYYFVQ